MIRGPFHRLRTLTAGLLAVALSIGGLTAGLSGARVQTKRGISATVATGHLDAVPSARVLSVLCVRTAPAHAPLLGALIAVRRSSLQTVPPSASAGQSAQLPRRPRRLAFRYDATAPPSVL